MKIIYTISEAEKELSELKQCEVKIEDLMEDLTSKNAKNDYLNYLKTITLSKTSSKGIIGKSKVFSYIDCDFENWNLNNKQEKTEEAKVNIYELIKDSTFKDFFTSLNKDLDKLVLTQSQIIEFCKNHKEDLRQDGYATFFLMKENDEYFVVYVSVRSGGLNAVVNRLEVDHLWGGGDRHRIVSPQL